MPSYLRSRLSLRLSLANWLVVVSLLAWAPMLVFASVMVHGQVADQQAREQALIARRAQATAIAIGHHLDSTVFELGALARADHLTRGDMAVMHAYAQRVVQIDGRVRSISLTDVSGNPVFNTAVPFGDPMPRARSADFHAPLFKGAQRVVSPLIADPLTQGPAITVAVPVEVQGRPLHALSASINLDEVGERLTDQAWPADWTASVLDQKDVIIASSRDPQRFFGQSATESLRAGIRGVAMHFVASTKDGIEVIGSASQVPGSGWVVVVGQPVEALKAEVRQSVAVVLIAGMACAAFGVALAISVARPLGRQLRNVVTVAQSGPLNTALTSQVTEIAQLVAELRRARHGQGQATEKLLRARQDTLTGLPGRAQFLDAASDLLTRAAAHPDQNVGLLFIDLDGFKQANDRLGHDVGDRILKKVGAALRACIRADDVAGRIGGDEFVVCLVAPRPQAQDIAFTLAERIVDTVSRIGEDISCSAGVAIARSGDDLDTIIRRADQAMLAAKRAGKGRVVSAT